MKGKLEKFPDNGQHAAVAWLSIRQNLVLYGALSPLILSLPSKLCLQDMFET